MTRRGKAAGLAALTVPLALLSLSSFAEESEYEIRLPASAEVPLGGEGSLSLTIAPRPGHTISRDGPLVVELAVDPEEGLAPKKLRYRRKDAADARAEAPRFDLAMRGKTAGSYRVNVSIRFWVCAKRTCRPVKETRAVEVTVPSPPPDAGPPPGGD